MIWLPGSLLRKFEFRIQRRPGKDCRYSFEPEAKYFDLRKWSDTAPAALGGAVTLGVYATQQAFSTNLSLTSRTGPQLQPQSRGITTTWTSPRFPTTATRWALLGCLKCAWISERRSECFFFTHLLKNSLLIVFPPVRKSRPTVGAN